MTREVLPPDHHVGGGGVLVHHPVGRHVAAQLALNGGEVHTVVSSEKKMTSYLMSSGIRMYFHTC